MNVWSVKWNIFYKTMQWLPADNITTRHSDVKQSHLYILNTGSLLHPLSLTPRDVGSMRKWRTSSLAGSFVLFWRLGGGVATFSASPNAPGNELESRTTNVPGAWSRSILIAVNQILDMIRHRGRLKTVIIVIVNFHLLVTTEFFVLEKKKSDYMYRLVHLY
jgi:hypothetical protein